MPKNTARKDQILANIRDIQPGESSFGLDVLDAFAEFYGDSRGPNRHAGAVGFFAGIDFASGHAVQLRIALDIIRNWNHGPAGYDGRIMRTLNTWVDNGAQGPIPWPEGPFFADWAAENNYVNRDGYITIASPEPRASASGFPPQELRRREALRGAIDGLHAIYDALDTLGGDVTIDDFLGLVGEISLEQITRTPSDKELDEWLHELRNFYTGGFRQDAPATPQEPAV